MPWFNVDDTLHSHPKPRRAGLAAMGLWTMAGSHAMSYKSDGFVPRWYVKTWPHGYELAVRLVQSGLWVSDTFEGQDGWRFKDWHDYQKTSAEIESDRAFARERQRRLRAARSKARANREEEF